MRGISDECWEWRPAVYYPRSDILDRPPSGLTAVHRNFGLGEVCSKPSGIFLLGYPIAGRPGTGPLDTAVSTAVQNDRSNLRPHEPFDLAFGPIHRRVDRFAGLRALGNHLHDRRLRPHLGPNLERRRVTRNTGDDPGAVASFRGFSKSGTLAGHRTAAAR